MCLLKLNCHFPIITVRERSALWAWSEVSGKGRTQRSVSKERATHQPLTPNHVNAQIETSTGEHSTDIENNYSIS